MVNNIANRLSVRDYNLLLLVWNNIHIYHASGVEAAEPGVTPKKQPS